MNIGSKNNKFNCLYVNAIHMGGHTYTSLNSGGGKIASYKATASQVNYNDDPKVETSVNTAGDTLTFKFSILREKTEPMVKMVKMVLVGHKEQLVHVGQLDL